MTFAAVGVLPTATGHLLGSGRPVPGRALLLAFAGTALAARRFTDREHDPLTVTSATTALRGPPHTVSAHARPVVGAPTAAAHALAHHAHTGPWPPRRGRPARRPPPACCRGTWAPRS
ncbi:hypothetical protein [Streptomyces chilikensis]|uniref:Uncharacterized protein n=1 Tax=Streptomyces chilikensis TaxID=1194079 RepID=A0ABV3EPB1_9ACTN